MTNKTKPTHMDLIRTLEHRVRLLERAMADVVTGMMAANHRQKGIEEILGRITDRMNDGRRT